MTAPAPESLFAVLEPVVSVSEASPGPTASPAPTIIHKASTDRNTRYYSSRLIDPKRMLSSRAARPHISSIRREATPIIPVTQHIVSERAAVGAAAVPSVRKKPKSPISVSESSASDLSDARPRRRHRRHRSRSSSSSSRSRRHRRHRRHRDRDRTPPPPAPAVPEKNECVRCSKPRLEDPLDPAINSMSAKKKERLRQEIIRRIQSLKRNNPRENIQLPTRGLRDPVVCYRRYRRIARHLYAKRSINSYRLCVFVFILMVQVAVSNFFGDAASEYLKREFDDIAKYDGVFYQMGCRAYSPSDETGSPKYRFAYQLVVPIVLIAIIYFLGRYTPVPPTAIGLFSGIISEYLKSGETVEYRTLLQDEELDEPDESESESECGGGDGPMIALPDLEADLPAESSAAAAIQAAVPNLVNMITSLRAHPEGTEAPSMVGTLMGLAQSLMNTNRKPAAAAAPPFDE